MKNILKLILFSIIVSILSTGCEKIFMEPNPETNNIAIFEEYWKLVDEKYAMWGKFDNSSEYKPLNREEIYTNARNKVTNEISQDSLFHVLGEIVHAFKDGHTYLESNTAFAYYDIEAIGEKNIDTAVVNKVYLGDDYLTKGPRKRLKYKLIENGKVGFIEIRTWMITLTDDDINDIINYFNDTDGVIIDVRENGGGDPFASTLVARHFVTEKFKIGSEHFKTGPGENDFSTQDLYANPADGEIYTKPTMVLTNNLCFSATTTFIYTMNPFDHIKFIGSKTGGGSGSTADGFLANGWIWQMSTSEFIDWEGRHLDNGFEPDIKALVDTLDTSQDEVIERAIKEIELLSKK
jgi:hypothetical protein